MSTATAVWASFQPETQRTSTGTPGGPWTSAKAEVTVSTYAWPFTSPTTRCESGLHTAMWTGTGPEALVGGSTGASLRSRPSRSNSQSVGPTTTKYWLSGDHAASSQLGTATPEST